MTLVVPRSLVLPSLLLIGCPSLSGVSGDSDGSSSDSGTETDASPPQDTGADAPQTQVSDGGEGTGADSSDTTGHTDAADGEDADDTTADDTASGGQSTGTEEGGCTPFPPMADFAATGPFAVTQEAAGSDCTVFRPSTLGDNGLAHPVILWGNGTTASPGIYAGVLSHWASQGFIVAAANTSNAGSGIEILACLDWLTEQDADDASAYGGAIDLGHIGVAGHSQGGGGALMAGQDPRITVTAPLQPYTQQGFGGYEQSCQGNQHGPMFLMSGTADIISPIVPQQQRVFDDTNVATMWGKLALADHVFTAIGDINGYRGPATAWFRYHLMCDESAAPVFYEPCELCDDPQWDVQTKNW
ncbi:MAG: hypothetical protein JKY37_05340 [Nannocystaceae bacterium]|nr:hypothetical protein [Nannocystaceae bacterium]